MDKKSLNLLRILIALQVITLLLTGFSLAERFGLLEGKASDAEKPLVFSCFNAQHPVVRLMRLGFWDACEENGWECTEVLVQKPDADAYVSALEQIETMDARGAVIYCDTEAMMAAARKLTDVMPTVSFHLPHEKGESPTTAWVSADTTAYAIDAAERIGEKLGGEGTVATSMSAPNGVEDAVIEAFTDTMADKYPSITVMPPIYEGLDMNEAIAKAAAQVTANPELNAAFSTTGGGAHTWAVALRDAGYEPGEVIVVGMDYTEQNLELIKEGEVWGVVGQPLVEETYEAALIVDKISRGESYNEQNWLPAPFVTAENLDHYLDYIERSQE